MEKNFEQKKSGSHILRIVLFGPESTGKTTLARELAAYYNEPWVPEYMRGYLQEKWDREKKLCTPEDLVPIARGQLALENEMAEKASKMIFCDTNILQLKVYSEVYYQGFCPPEIRKHAQKNLYDLYILTYIDVPWEADDLRDKPGERDIMFKEFEKELISLQKPYIILRGDKKQRFKRAVEAIDKLIK